MTEEMEIDLKDLLYRILKKWRMILTLCIVMAIVADIASIGVSFLGIKKSKKELSTLAAELLELRSELTDREVAEVDEMFENYKRLRDSGEVVEEYNKNSILMHIEANEVPTVKLRYNIDTHYKVLYPVISAKDYTNELMSEYRSILNSDEALNEIKVAFSDDVKPEYIREIVSVSNDNASILEITVIAPEKTQCEQISETIKKIVEDKKQEIGSKYGSYDLNLIDEAYTEEVRTDILESQQSRYSKGDSIRNSLANLGAKLSTDEKAYYQALIDYEIAKEQKTLVASKKRELLGKGVSVEEEKTYTSEIYEENDLSKAEDMISAEVIYEDGKLSFVSVKFIVIGFVLGGIIACGIICCGYLFVPLLRTADTMNTAFSLSLLENIWIKDEKKKTFAFIDNFIDKLFCAKVLKISAEDKLELAVEKITIIAEKAGYKKLHITGASENVSDIVKKICEKLSLYSATSGKLISEDVESLRQMADSEGVVLVEGVEESRIDDIVKEIELIGSSNAKIIGSVVINRY